jgi:hypothetical protein
MTFRAAAGARMTLDSTGIDVTGSVVADGLVSSGDITLEFAGVNSDPAGARYLTFDNTDTTLVAGQPLGGINWEAHETYTGINASIKAYAAGNGGEAELRIYTGQETEAMRITNAGNVGIGSSSPTSFSGYTALEINNATNGAILDLSQGDTMRGRFVGTTSSMAIETSGSIPIVFQPGGLAEAMRIDSSGNVGIGRTPTTHILETAGEIKLVSLGANQGIDAYNTSSRQWGIKSTSATADGVAFEVNNAERMRIDSSGDLLVGTTNSGLSSSSSATGINLIPNGASAFVRDGGAVLYLNRLTSDGSIVQFRKDGTTIGSWRSRSGLVSSLVLDPRSTNSGCGIGTTDGLAIVPTDNTGALVDSGKDLGQSGIRWRDLYRSGSTYSTSDRNMKQDIRDLTDAESNVAVACKGLLKAFRFIDTVEKDGDDANIHFGVIAQELAEAFEAEGLDANDYQVYKSATITDEDGNEQTRLNVCYENLLAFIIAAI